MRKILFRGKRIDNGEWVEGHYGEYMLMSGESIPCISIPNKEAVCGSTCCDVEASTVGQYTGLTDKNGKKIFEGDIVKTSHGGSTYYAKIEWDDGSFWVTNHDIQMPSYISEVSKTYLEIIDNIHDNPKLLNNFKNQ